MERTDELLMEAYRNGDQAAFFDLVHRYKNLLFGYLMRMTQNRETAEDLFQETFLRVHRNAHTYRIGTRFKSWLFTIATHIAIDRLRRNSRRPLSQSLENDDPVAAESAHDPAKETAKQELRDIVKKAIESLPPKQRAVLILSYYDGYTYPEIAQILHCSLSSVKTHMSRALKKLAARLPMPEGVEL